MKTSRFILTCSLSVDGFEQSIEVSVEVCVKSARPLAFPCQSKYTKNIIKYPIFGLGSFVIDSEYGVGAVSIFWNRSNATI